MTDETAAQHEPPATTGATRTRPRAETVNHLQRTLAYLREGDSLGPESIGAQDAIAEVYALRAIGHGLVTLGGELRLANQIEYLTALLALAPGERLSDEARTKVEALEQSIDAALGFDR